MDFYCIMLELMLFLFTIEWSKMFDSPSSDMFIDSLTATGPFYMIVDSSMLMLARLKLN